MAPTSVFALALSLNFAGAGLLLGVLLIVLIQSNRARLNMLLASYVGICLLWSTTAFVSRVVMTSRLTTDLDPNNPIFFALIVLVLIGLCGNSPFLLAFSMDYCGKWDNPRWRRLLALAATINGVTTIGLVVQPDLFLNTYSITEIGMIAIDPTLLGVIGVGSSYFVWYAVSLGLMLRYAMPRARYIVFGILLTSGALAIEIVTTLGDILPIAITASGIASLCFGYTVLRDRVLNPLKTSNAKLLRNQQNLEHILSRIPAATFVTTFDGTMIWGNERTAEIFGLPLEQALGNNTAQFYASPDERRRVIGKFARDRRVIGEEFEFKTQDNVRRWGRMSIVPFDFQSDPALLVIVEDTHDQKLAHASLQQAQKWESLAVLAGGVAHDFNNLLVSILGQASLLEAKIGDNPALTRHVTRLISSSHRAADLTKQMLAYSGRGQFVTRQVNLNEVVHDNLPLIEATTRHVIPVELELAETLPMIHADPTQIQQIIMNLAINAAQAIDESKAGKIRFVSGLFDASTMQIGEADWQMRIGTPKESTYVCLDVIDSGVGMPSETLQQIFDPFFTTKETGTGLGLAAVLGIIRGHGGLLLVKSQLGVGTTFRLLFPVASDKLDQQVAQQFARLAATQTEALTVTSPS